MWHPRARVYIKRDTHQNIPALFGRTMTPVGFPALRQWTASSRYFQRWILFFPFFCFAYLCFSSPQADELIKALSYINTPPLLQVTVSYLLRKLRDEAALVCLLIPPAKRWGHFSWGFRPGFRISLESGIRVRTWVMYYVYESPHKDRNMSIHVVGLWYSVLPLLPPWPTL